MNVASRELCEELFKISGWNDTFWNYSRSSYSDFPFKLGHKGSIETREVKERYPAYDLGYLFRKLPYEFKLTKYINANREIQYQVTHHSVNKLFNICTDSPENAAASLAIALFKAGILKKEEL